MRVAPVARGVPSAPVRGGRTVSASCSAGAHVCLINLTISIGTAGPSYEPSHGSETRARSWPRRRRPGHQPGQMRPLTSRYAPPPTTYEQRGRERSARSSVMGPHVRRLRSRQRAHSASHGERGARSPHPVACACAKWASQQRVSGGADLVITQMGQGGTGAGTRLSTRCAPPPVRRIAAPRARIGVILDRGGPTPWSEGPVALLGVVAGVAG